MVLHQKYQIIHHHTFLLLSQIAAVTWELYLGFAVLFFK